MMQVQQHSTTKYSIPYTRGYILWGIAVGAKREQQELRPERMGQPRGHGQVRSQVRPRLRPWQQPNRFSFFELPKKIMALTAMSLCCLQPSLSKVFYLELTCSNLKVFSNRRMCTNLKQKSEQNSLFYYSVLTLSNAFPKNTDSKIHISKPYINLLNLRM